MLFGGADATAQPEAKPSPDRGVLPGVYWGNISCGGAQGCHNAPPPLNPDALGRIIGDEIPIWENSDPHSRALTSLDPEENAVAKQMMEKGKSWAPFTKSQACLTCHAVSSNLTPAQIHADWKNPLKDAVSCESCHGPADKWLVPHAKVGWAADIRKANPKPKDAVAAFLKFGLKDTTHLATRTTGCVACHLQIDKDILDAGHPPLVFEMYWFNSYLRKDPAGKPAFKQHWDDRLALKPGGELFNARLWASGQVAGLAAANDQVKAWKAKGWDTKDVEGLAATYLAGVGIVKKHFGTDDLDELSVVEFKLPAVQTAATELAALAPTATTAEQRRIVGYGVLALVRAAYEAENATKKPGEIWKDIPEALKAYRSLVNAKLLAEGGAEFENMLKVMAEKVQ